MIPLDKPYQKGFVRFFVVRDDVKQSKDGDFFEGILKKINTYMYSDNRKFLKKKEKKVRKKDKCRKRTEAQVYYFIFLELSKMGTYRQRKTIL